MEDAIPRAAVGKSQCSMLDQSSLAVTLENVTEALFNLCKITAAEKAAVVRWLLARHGLTRSYCGMCSPTDKDFLEGAQLFTGEKLTSGAQTSHILGEEAMRTLRLLGGSNKAVKAALDQSGERLMHWIWESPHMPEKFCCYTCTVALWRNLVVGNLECQEQIMSAGLKRLNSRRQGNGRWQTFPFYYTVLALCEMPFGAAAAELKYAAPVLERVARRGPGKSRLTARRRELAVRALAKIC